MLNIDHLLLKLLNLTSNEVDSIESTKNEDDSLTYYVVLKTPQNLSCPYCGDNKSFHSKGYYSKTEIVSNDLFKNDKIILKQKRLVCLNCHHSFHVDSHSCPPKSSVSYEIIIKVMELLKDPTITFKQAAKLTGISPQTVTRIFDKHCHIERKTFPEAICIDEVYTKNNDFDSKYACIFYDFYNEKVIEVYPSRKKNDLYYYLSKIDHSSELLSVKYVSIDMHKTYKVVAKKFFKKATICVDSFHVIKLLNDCLSNLRVRLMNQYDKSSIEYYLLKVFKNLLFKNDLDSNYKKKFNKRFNKYMNYFDLQQELLSISEELSTGYYLVQQYMKFNRESTYEQAKEKFPDIYNLFIKNYIDEFAPFITALSNWQEEIINSFIVYKGKRINSSVAESINSRISLLLFNTRGIRKHERRRKRIMYAINKEGFLLK